VSEDIAVPFMKPRKETEERSTTAPKRIFPSDT